MADDARTSTHTGDLHPVAPPPPSKGFPSPAPAHPPAAACAWRPGGGNRGARAPGGPAEIGSPPSENRHYITDVHATALQQLGLDAHKLEVPGRTRLEMDYGKPIKESIA